MVTHENVSWTDNVTLGMSERGYLDFGSWSALINTTTVSVPDGVSFNTSRVLVSNVTYIQTPTGWVKSDDSSTADFIWRYNIVSLARKYLGMAPDHRESGEGLVLEYHLSDYDVRELASIYFVSTPNTTITVKGGVLKLYFENGELVGGMINFSVITRTSIEDPTMGKITITQDGSWSETVRITSVNEKMEVKAPST